MPITWTDDQRTAIQDCLSKHPANSSRCLEAAKEILPTARKQDSNATPWKICPRPGFGFFVCPKVSVKGRWFHHFTVEASSHCVDALTGIDGTLKVTYLAQHWQYGDALEWVSTAL